MSGLMHKVKDALSGEKDTPEARAANQGNNEYGSSTNPHHEGIAGSHHRSGVDPTDSDLTGKRGGAGYDNSTTSGYGGQTTGTTGGDYGRDTSTTGAGYGSTGYDDNSRTSGTGPHSSSLANKADPRIDSDRDGKTGLGRDTTSSTTGAGYGSSGYDDNSRTSGTGPHSSSLANKADPRVDSDRDGKTGFGRDTTTSTSGAGYGSSGYDDNTRGTGLGGSGTSGLGTSGYDNTSRTSGAGPHSSSLANKADPRVDSDRDGRSGLGGTGSSHHQSGHHGGIGGKVDDLVHGGEHHTRTANALDPHVSGGSGPLETGYGTSNTTSGLGSSTSGYDNSGATGLTGGSSGYDNSSGTGLTGGSTSSGYGNDRSTGSGLAGSSGYDNERTSGAGPHSSTLANKADPRVDSDRDGRSGLGGSTTGSGGYGGGSTGTGNY